MTTRQKIVPCLWFNFNAQEAVDYYLSIFKNSKILDVSHYGDAMPEHKGKVLTLLFEIEGQQFQALNGGSQFPFTEAISLSVRRKQKLTCCGANYPQAEVKVSVAG